MTNENVYQIIFDEITDYLPNNWSNLIIYLEYGEDSYSFSFYVNCGNGYVKCYDIAGIDENKLLESFAKIDKVVSVERNRESKALWSNMTILIDNTGNIHADYDYSDLSNGTYEYKKEWKEKYL